MNSLQSRGGYKFIDDFGRYNQKVCKKGSDKKCKIAQ